MEYILSDFSSDEEDILGYLNHIEPVRRRQRSEVAYVEIYNAAEYQRRYRLTKETVHWLCTKLEDNLRSNSVNALTVEEQVVPTLRYYATGTFQSVLADLSGHVHQTTISSVVRKVSRAIAGLKEDYIKFPTSAEEQKDVVNDFYKISRMPYVIGTIDCTHIAVSSRGGDFNELFRNRKGWFSLNVQTISDALLRIRDLVSRWYGSAHDSTIFRSCYRRVMFERGTYGRNFLLGDNGYRCVNYLLTPLLNPASPAEFAYNRSHKSTRNTVERQYGVWKHRFPCLDLGIRLRNLLDVQAVITATAVLHNLSILLNDPEPAADPDLQHEVMQARRRYPPVPTPALTGGAGFGNTAARKNLIQNHFFIRHRRN